MGQQQICYLRNKMKFFSFFKRIVNNSKYRLRKIYFSSFYDEKKFIELQKNNFKQIGWEFDDALNILNSILKKFKIADEFNDRIVSMQSHHWIAFSAILERKPKKILEIGTFDGKTTLLLSKLFPESEIITVDLPDESNEFINSYNRSNEKFRKKILKNRKNNLNEKNITFIQDNSFNIPKYKFDKFDLIWVDGDHDYPALGWDVCNAYHLLNTGGILMCDDIYLNSSSTFKILDYLEKEKIFKANYILKRTSKDFSADPKVRKHIAVIKKM